MKTKRGIKTIRWFLAFAVISMFAMANSVFAAPMDTIPEEIPTYLDKAKAERDTGSTRIYHFNDNISDDWWYSGYKFYPYGDDRYVDAFCISTDLIVGSSGYQLNPVPEIDRFENAAILASNFFFNEDFAYSQTVIQVAIWEIMFDDGTDVSTGSGAYYLDNERHADLITQVNDLLGYYKDGYTLVSLGGQVAHAIRTDVEGGDGSDIEAQEFYVPVPEPMATLLIAIGLIGLIGIGRRKRYFQA